jgi:uncharacterized membrane protein YhaH (DUF805 family)
LVFSVDEGPHRPAGIWPGTLWGRPGYYDGIPPFDGSIVRTLLSLSLWPFAAIVVKRLHDFNISGWWALAILAFPHLTRALGIPYWIPYLLVAATLSALPAWPGDNRFGPDPLRRSGV